MKKNLVPRTLVVISAFLIFFSSAYSQTVGVFHNSSQPQIAFAAGDVKSALEKRGLRVEMKELSALNSHYSHSKVVITLQTDAAALDLMTAQGGEATDLLGPQAYALRTTGASTDLSCWLIGGDANGAMYGGLQVAEYISFGGLKGIHNEEDAPYIEKRGIKFNIPLDVRSPSFSDKGDAALTNIKHMWDLSFWSEYFDVLARHRYNVISFWSKHPFSTMVKVPGYENAVIEDVRDHEGLVKIMPIEEKIKFWQDVMQLAHNRGFEIYFINWNIFTSGASGKYGIDNSRTNQTTIDYTRKSIYQFLLTYPLLTGIGVSAGENFGDASFEQREEWLYATFGEALWDYYREDPDRDLTFIHRYLDSGVGSIMAEFKNLPQKYRIDISFKYTLGHLYTYHAPTYIYKTQDTRENVVAQLDTYNKKCWMNLRNDDLFYLRWGSPDYVRDYLSNFPDKEKYVAGYYMGSDGYVWGRVFSSENALFQGDLEVNKHWYRFMLWGRLGYNPNLADSVFIHTIAARFGQEQAKQIFDAWNSASRAFTTTNSLIWWMWDGWWYPEGSKRAQGWRDVDDFINTSPPQGAPIYSITEYKKRLSAGDPMEKLSPLEVAREIRAYANTALGTDIHMDNSEELRLISNDIKALGYMGLYFAEKIEGAVYHHLGQKDDAISHMQKAYWHWKSYTEIGDAMYKDQRLARTGMFRWGDYDDDAINDIISVGGSGPGEEQFQYKSIVIPDRPDRDQFPSFDKNKDLLLFQFDNRPDPDDIHSQAAVGSMIQHSDFDGVKVYAVLGATGTQGHKIINSTSLMKLIFGPEGSDTWTDARSFYEKDGIPNQAWINSVERVRNIAKPILMNGGNIWVMEAGQSHITRDWIEALQANGVSQDICKARIFVVQHSNWNHSHNRKEDLDFLKENAVYIRIADGNRDTNDPGEENNDTPDFQTDDTEVQLHKELRSAAKTDANPNAATRAIWNEADRIIEDLGFHAKWSSISKGGLDFSDTSEAWWIMDLGDKVNTLPEFWDRYVMAGEDDIAIMGAQVIYSNSDGSTFVPKNCYPKFSWESTPMYYMFGDTKHLLTPEEVKFIAGKTSFLTIEKSHGLDVLGAAELGTKHEAAAFKKINPDIKVLFYFNSAWAWPFTSYNKNFTPEKINDYPELKKYLLVNPETGELNFREHYIRHTYSFDVLNPDFRKWWVETVVRGVEESGCDGAFIDQMHGFFSLREDRKEEVHKAQGEMISALKKKLGPDKIVLGNNTTDEIARYAYSAIDANMFEHYSSALLSKEKLLQDWDDMLRLARDGKMSIFRIGVGKGPFVEEYESIMGTARTNEERMVLLAKERIEYHLACFLIGAQPYSFFQYGWGWDLSDGSLYDYPELHKPLGAPKGAYIRTDPNGWEFTREFEHASVWLDTEKGKAKINWK